MILEHLKDNKALFAALQVNKLWADEATTLLWRKNPRVLDLARIEDVNRVQYYAAKISELEIELSKNDCKGHLRLQDVHFPRLKRIAMKIRDCKKEHKFSQYLQPHLRTVIVSGGPLSNFHLMQIQARCPAVRQLALCESSNTITANDLLDFLGGMPSLVGIYLWSIISDELYFHLASRRTLATLKTGKDKTLTLSLVKGIQEVIDQPFPNLHSLKCFSESDAFSQLSRHLNGLTTLDLHLVDAASKTLFDICSCTNLVDLSLKIQDSHFEPNSHFSPEGLLALAKNCPHLQIFAATALQVYGEDGGSIANVANITDDVIQKFVALLPGLTYFRLGIKTSLTERALQLIGEACTGLTHCSLDGRSFNLQLVGSSDPVFFPRLKYLAVQPIEDCLSATMIAEMLYHHAPRATILRLGSSKGLIRDVGENMPDFKRVGGSLFRSGL